MLVSRLSVLFSGLQRWKRRDGRAFNVVPSVSEKGVVEHMPLLLANAKNIDQNSEAYPTCLEKYSCTHLLAHSLLFAPRLPTDWSQKTTGSRVTGRGVTMGDLPAMTPTSSAASWSLVPDDCRQQSMRRT